MPTWGKDGNKQGDAMGARERWLRSLRDCFGKSIPPPRYTPPTTLTHPLPPRAHDFHHFASANLGCLAEEKRETLHLTELALAVQESLQASAEGRVKGVQLEEAPLLLGRQAHAVGQQVPGHWTWREGGGSLAVGSRRRETGANFKAGL